MTFTAAEFAQACMRWGVRLATGAQAQWVGCVPDTVQRIYFSNHQSHLDTIAIWSALPAAIRRSTRPVAAKDYWDKGGWRRWLARDVLNALLIDRLHVSVRNNPLNGLLQALDAGSSLILFPEGTRNSEEGLREFRSGLYHLAKRRPDVELIPVYLDNMNRILPKGRHIPLPLICSVRFGAPVRFEHGEYKDAFLGRARAAVEGLGGARAVSS